MPASSNPRTAESPSASRPTRATRVTAPPARAAATAWFAPFPPAARVNAPPSIVSPGPGKRGALMMRSVFELPITRIWGLGVREGAATAVGYYTGPPPWPSACPIHDSDLEGDSLARRQRIRIVAGDNPNRVGARPQTVPVPEVVVEGARRNVRVNRSCRGSVEEHVRTPAILGHAADQCDRCSRERKRGNISRCGGCLPLGDADSVPGRVR